ncbi:MAG: hypothetical protein K6T30_09650, partial [Alicyclobacillus sp.]|nr:hypothetical protein [Alicyclobacillus sp.]
LSLLFHALFDFDFSFPMVAVTFFLLLGVAASRPAVFDPGAAAEPRPGNGGASGLRGRVRRVAPVTTALLALSGCAAVVLGVMLSVSQHLYSRAQAAVQPVMKQVLLQQAIRWAPFDPVPHLALAQLDYSLYLEDHSRFNLNMAWKEVQEAAARAPWDPGIQMNAATIAYKLGNLNEAYQWAKRSYLDGPFHIQYPDTYMGIGLWTAVLQYQQDPAEAQRRFRDIVTVYHTAQQNVEDEQHMPYGFHPEWPYAPDAPMQVYAATADLALGRYQASLQDMTPLSQTNLDASAQGLAKLVAYLDHRYLGDGLADPQAYRDIQHDATLKAEYGYLTKIISKR